MQSGRPICNVNQKAFFLEIGSRTSRWFGSIKAELKKVYREMRREFPPKMFDYRSEKSAAQNTTKGKKKVSGDYSFDCIQAHTVAHMLFSASKPPPSVSTLLFLINDLSLSLFVAPTDLADGNRVVIELIAIIAACGASGVYVCTSCAAS